MSNLIFCLSTKTWHYWMTVNVHEFNLVHIAFSIENMPTLEL